MSGCFRRFRNNRNQRTRFVLKEHYVEKVCCWKIFFRIQCHIRLIFRASTAAGLGLLFQRKTLVAKCFFLFGLKLLRVACELTELSIIIKE